MRNEREANEALRATYTRENVPTWTRPAPKRQRAPRPSLLQRIVRRITQP